MRLNRPPLVLLVAALSAACGKHTPTSPSSMPSTSPSSMPLTEVVQTPDYTFRYAPGDSVDSAWQQQYFAWAVAALDIRPSGPITYNKYVSRAHMGDLTGRYSTNAYAEPSSYTIHTIWPTDGHEVIHVYSATFGTPVALFNEGIAVAHQTDPARGDLTARWNGTSLHDWARTFRRQGTLLSLNTLVASADFRRFDPNVTYPQSGSFVRYLLDHDGLDRLKRLFRDGNYDDNAASVLRQFQAAYGRSLADAENEWLAMLDGR